jgi:hypothetical protein
MVYLCSDKRVHIAISSGVFTVLSAKRLFISAVTAGGGQFDRSSFLSIERCVSRCLNTPYGVLPFLGCDTTRYMSVNGWGIRSDIGIMNSRYEETLRVRIR